MESPLIFLMLTLFRSLFCIKDFLFPPDKLVDTYSSRFIFILSHDNSFIRISFWVVRSNDLCLVSEVGVEIVLASLRVRLHYDLFSSRIEDLPTTLLNYTKCIFKLNKNVSAWDDLKLLDCWISLSANCCLDSGAWVWLDWDELLEETIILLYLENWNVISTLHHVLQPGDSDLGFYLEV